jgi:hypothetical protein
MHPIHGSASTVTVQSLCRFEILSLLQVTQDLLEQRASSADLNSQPQLYDVLYDFYCMRSNFKAAAAAQYTLACRLRDEAKHVPHCLHQRAAALCKPFCSFPHLAGHQLDWRGILFC